MLGPIQVLITKLASVVATQRRLSNFTCGDCERWQRCGLPPNANCVVKVVHATSGDWKTRRKALMLDPHMRW